MSTLSTTSLNWLASEWEDSYTSAVLSGIVGDLAHKARGGYHISREDQPSTNYSVIRTDDKPGNGPSDRAAAIDMTMSTADIIKCHSRLRTFWKNNDPRMKYINAWNGWDGNGDAGRYDVVNHTIATATADHKWHIHLEIRRRYVNDTTAMKAILAMLKGESGTVIPVSPAAPTKPVEVDMTKEEMLEVLKSAAGREAIGYAVLGYDPGLNADGTVKGAGIKNLDEEGFKTNPTVGLAFAAGNRGQVMVKLGYQLRDETIPALKQELLAAINKDTVDEAAIATALTANTAFINSLASALSSKLPTGVQVTPAELSAAVKTALREGVAK